MQIRVLYLVADLVTERVLCFVVSCRQLWEPIASVDRKW